MGSQASSCSGGHVRQAAAEIGRGSRSFKFRAEADVEVDELRHGLGGQKDVGRFEVAMQDAAGVARNRGPGQAERPTRQTVSGQSVESSRSSALPTRPGQFHPRRSSARSTASSRVLPERSSRGYCFDHSMACSSVPPDTHFHVQQPEISLWEHALVVDAHDIGMVELGQRLRLASLIATKS